MAEQVIEQVLVRIKPGRGTHTTSDGMLHRSTDEEPFLIDVSVYNTFSFQFDLCDPETGAALLQTLPTVQTVRRILTGEGQDPPAAVDPETLQARLASASEKTQNMPPTAARPTKKEPVKK